MLNKIFRFFFLVFFLFVPSLTFRQ
jgi:hypothetical protein